MSKYFKIVADEYFPKEKEKQLFYPDSSHVSFLEEAINNEFFPDLEGEMVITSIFEFEKNGTPYWFVMLNNGMYPEKGYVEILVEDPNDRGSKHISYKSIKMSPHGHPVGSKLVWESEE